MKHDIYDTSKVKTVTINGKKYVNMSVIEKIKAEIKQAPKRYPYNDNINNCLTEKEVINIIDRVIKELE